MGNTSDNFNKAAEKRKDPNPGKSSQGSEGSGTTRKNNAPPSYPHKHN